MQLQIKLNKKEGKNVYFRLYINFQYLRREGVNAGRNSMNAVYNQMMTKYNNGQIQNVSTQTAGKMFTGRAYNTGILEATTANSAISTYGSSNIAGYSDIPTSTDVAFNLGSEDNNTLED